MDLYAANELVATTPRGPDGLPDVTAVTRITVPDAATMTRYDSCDHRRAGCDQINLTVTLH